MLSETEPESMLLRLYSNDYDVAKDSTVDSFIQANGAGCKEKQLDRKAWNPASTITGQTIKSYPQQVFLFTDTITVVGYYVVGAVSNTLMFAERIYPSSGQVFTLGDSLKVLPRFRVG